MSRWMFLPIVALVYFVGSAMASTPGNRDHDGLPDRWEQRYGLSTTKNSAKGDPDRDGLRNRREYRLRTNPRKRDTDGDGYDDRVEVRAGTDPRDASNRPFPIHLLVASRAAGRHPGRGRRILSLRSRGPSSRTYCS